MFTVTVDEVRATFEEEISVDSEGRVSALIAEATQLLSEKLGDLTTWTADNVLRRGDAVLRSVTIDAVQAVLRSPGPYRSENEGSYGYSVDTSVASVRLRIHPDQWARLFAVSDSSNRQSTYGSVRFGIPGWSGRATW